MYLTLLKKLQVSIALTAVLMLTAVTVSYQSINQAVNQSINQSINQSNSLSQRAASPTATPTNHDESKIFSDVILLGQFNYHNPWNITAFWANQWHKVANKIIIYTPFTDDTDTDVPNNTLPEWLTVRHYPSDKGWISPVSNIVDAFKRFDADPVIKSQYKGILYLHDDMLLNLKTFAQTQSEDNWKTKLVYSCKFPNNRNNKSYSVENIGDGWYWWPLDVGLKNMRKAENDSNLPRKDIIAFNNDTTIRWFKPCQSDFAYIPFAAGKKFASIGDWLGRNEVFLEISMPMIMANLNLKHGFQLQQTTLCTTWGGARGNPEQMTKYCHSKGNCPFDLIHPVKIGLENINPEWMEWFYFGDLNETICK